MTRHPPRGASASRKAGALCPTCLRAGMMVALLATPLGACEEPPAPTAERAAFVRTEVVQLLPRQGSATLTGEVQARFRTDLSFRVAGRVVERLVDVGDHVDAGDVLARLDPTEQQADVDAAMAAVAAAGAQLRVAQSTYDRQRSLLADGFTTRPVYDQAEETLRSAAASLEAARAQLGTAEDALAYTVLRAESSGVITGREVEVGQVVQAAQPVFGLAEDGARDAVFHVPEAIFFEDFDGGPISLVLVSDPSVTTTARVREISPAINPKSATVRVKFSIDTSPPAMTLGSAVAGTARWKPVPQMTVPWSALMATGSTPAVWVVDPAESTASLKPITIGEHEAGAVVVTGGLAPGDRVVVDGGKLLSAGQRVSFEGSQS
jgi:membrane fusion protein, multidrug efflux system